MLQTAALKQCEQFCRELYNTAIHVTMNLLVNAAVVDDLYL